MLRVSQFQTLELPKSIRVVAQTTLDGEQRELWYEFSNRYAPFLTIDRSDALAAALLLECMYRGIDLYVEGVLSAMLLGNLEAYSQVMRTLFPALQQIRLHCDEVKYFDSLVQGRHLASSFSCGVDSLFTLQQRLAGSPEHRRLQHLAYFNVGSHGRGRAAGELFRKRASRVGRVAAQLDLPILFVDSNLDEFYTLRFEDSHAARTASAALLFQNLFHTYLFPSTNSYAAFGPDGSTPLSDHLLSSDATRFVHDGAHCSRIEKSKRLAQWPLAQQAIDVCMTPLPTGGNCSRCDKCVRAMITFDMLGVRQKFEGAFDFQHFGAAKQRFVARMTRKGIEAPNFYWRELVLHAEKTGYRLFKRIGSARASTVPRRPQASRRITAFWHREGNFGDQLTQLLLARQGVHVTHAPAVEANAIGVGSILERVPADYQGAILGAGFMFGKSRREFPQARFISVRGRLTAERCGLKTVLLGDLGLIVHHLFRKLPPVRRALAVIPHYVDRDHPLIHALPSQYPKDVAVIDVTAGARHVLEEIAASEAVISSSLHGLIAAQALMKPARWIVLSSKVYGGGFKFRDHFSAIGATCQPLQLAQNPSLSSILHELQPASSQWPERGDRLHQALVDWVAQLPISER